MCQPAARAPWSTARARCGHPGRLPPRRRHDVADRRPYRHTGPGEPPGPAAPGLVGRLGRPRAPPPAASLLSGQRLLAGARLPRVLRRARGLYAGRAPRERAEGRARALRRPLPLRLRASLSRRLSPRAGARVPAGGRRGGGRRLRLRPMAADPERASPCPLEWRNPSLARSPGARLPARAPGARARGRPRGHVAARPGLHARAAALLSPARARRALRGGLAATRAALDPAWAGGGERRRGGAPGGGGRSARAPLPARRRRPPRGAAHRCRAR